MKTSNTTCVKNYISEYSENIFSLDGNILFCKICDVMVTCEKRFIVLQHHKIGKHISGIERCSQQQKIQQRLRTATKINSFNKDLCKTLLAANIPIHKLLCCLFFEKYIHLDIPIVSLCLRVL